MDWYHILRFIAILIAVSSAGVISYEDDRYQSFGFRYYLACFFLLYDLLVLLALTLMSLLLAFFLFGKFSLVGLGILGLVLLLIASVYGFIYRLGKIQLQRRTYYKRRSISLCPVEIFDVDQLQGVEERILGPAPLSESAQQVLENFTEEKKSYYWILQQGRKIGFVRLTKEEQPQLEVLAFLPDYQGQDYEKETLLCLKEQLSDFQAEISSP